MSKNGFRLFKNYDPYITSPFGYRVNPVTKEKQLHAGVDYGTNDKELETYALEEGVVLETGFNEISGNFVYVKFPRLKKIGLYEHLSSINTKKDMKVDSNTVIGKTGDTGRVTGIHLHFGIFNESEYEKSWQDRNWEDFEKYDFPKKEDIKKNTNKKSLFKKIKEFFKNILRKIKEFLKKIVKK